MTSQHTAPTVKPVNPNFSSGPCSKFPGWSYELLKNAPLGRSHRAKIGKSRLQTAIDETKKLLEIPDDYLVAIVPGSDTGAVEMCLWSMLGAKPVDVFAWEAFSTDWVTDIVKQLKLPDTNIYSADYGHLPDLSKANSAHDIVFAWNGTTSGVRVPNGDWIADNREGITICDATSAVFAQKMPWQKLDVVTYSWQKVLGGEGAHGMLILSPKAVARLESYKPDRALPKLFRMTKNGKINTALFEGATINTPSMMCVEDYLAALAWVRSIGGLSATVRRADENAQALSAWVNRTAWIDFLCAAPENRTNTGVCLKIIDSAFAQADEAMQYEICKKISDFLEKQHVAYDINGYRDAPPGLRIWCGSTVEKSDIEALCAWIDYAWEEIKPSLKKAA
jgi:phosphoserine aminotransferase